MNGPVIVLRRCRNYTTLYRWCTKGSVAMKLQTASYAGMKGAEEGGRDRMKGEGGGRLVSSSPKQELGHKCWFSPGLVSQRGWGGDGEEEVVYWSMVYKGCLLAILSLLCFVCVHAIKNLALSFLFCNPGSWSLRLRLCFWQNANKNRQTWLMHKMHNQVS